MTQGQWNPEGKAQLYKTPDKQLAEKPRSPFMKCKFVLGGTPYEIALWKATDNETGQPRTDAHGQGFYTGAVKVDEYAQKKMQQQAAPQQPPRQAPPAAYQPPPPPPSQPYQPQSYMDGPVDEPQDGEEIPF